MKPRCLALVALAVLAAPGCAQDDEIGERAGALTVKSQLRGYDLGPPFPAGFRDSGLVNGYAEGEWVPMVAIMEGKKLAEADGLAGDIGDGVYGAAIIVPTYSPRHDANAIMDLQASGTYGEGAITPIPDPFDDGWLVAHGYSPLVLGAHADTGDVDLAPVLGAAAQRSGPTRFGGDVASVSVPIQFNAPPGASAVELRFAVRLALPELEKIAPDGQGFPGTTAGTSRGAGDFFPGPGPIFVGYEVGKPTGIATVPIRVERHGCESNDDCPAGQHCTVEECVKLESKGQFGTEGQTLSVGGVTVTLTDWVQKEDSPGEYVGFSYSTSDGSKIQYRVKAGPEVHFGTSSPWVHPGGTSGPSAPGISNITFCPGEDGDGAGPGQCEESCVDDSNCPTDEICEDGICQEPPPPCVDDSDCPDADKCIGGGCLPPCPEDGNDGCPEGNDDVGSTCDPYACYDNDSDGDTDADDDGIPDDTDPDDDNDGDPDVSDPDDDGDGNPDGSDQCPTDPDPCDGQCVPDVDTGECDSTPPCIYDNQCADGYVCEDGVCQPPVSPCNMTCPEGEVCQDGFCEPPGTPCQDDADCPGGETCAGGFCHPGQPPCVGDGCAPCQFDADCPGGEVCVEGNCHAADPPHPCTADGDCPDGQICEGGYCDIPEPCQDDGDCPSGSVCDETVERCVPQHPPVPCDDVSDCPAGDSCTGGYCVPPDTCQDDGDCPSGTVCDDTVELCVPPHPPVPCQDTSECPSGDVCAGGWCTPDGNECKNDNHCQGSDVCLGGVCQPPRPPCSGGADCPSGVCDGGYCVPPHDPIHCDAPTDCPAGDTCAGGFCTSDTCTDDGDCAPGTVCDGSVDMCVPPHPPIPCSLDTDCPAGDTCEAGYCAPQEPCDNDSDCPGGEVCHDEDAVELCVPGQPPTPCTVDTDCPADTCGYDDVNCEPVCYGGYCTPGGDACTGDADCPGGYGCVDGQCLPVQDPIACDSQYDCGGAQTCSGGFCEPGGEVAECETTSDCYGYDDVSSLECIGGVCVEPSVDLRVCTTDAVCPAGHVCKDGYCFRAEGLCELDGDCSGGESCISGWCDLRCGDDGSCGAGSTCSMERCVATCTTYAECGPYEACWSGGCVPLYAFAGKKGGETALWNVALPGQGNVEGGCQVGGGSTPSGLTLLVIAALLGLGRRARRGKGA